jgi:hypothetical protein
MKKNNEGFAGFVAWVVAFLVLKVWVFSMLGKLSPKPPPRPAPTPTPQVDQAERIMRDGVRPAPG